MRSRAIILLLLMCVLLSALCACGNEAPAAAEPTPEPTPVPPAYDAVPDKAEDAVTVDGTEPDALFSVGDTVYVRLDGADGETVQNAEGKQTSRGTDLFEAELSFDGNELVLNNDSVDITLNGEALDLPGSPLFDGESWYIPMDEYYTALGYGKFYDEEQAHLYYTDVPDPAAVPEGYKAPVLMYHAVSDDCWGIDELFVSPEYMEQQLQYLNDNGFTTIFFSDLEHIDEIEKPVILTFDDGYDDNYDYLFPLLQKYNCKATVFVIAANIGCEHMLTEEQVREMSDSGLVDIQSHSMTHPNMDRINHDRTVYELEQSQLVLLRLTGKLPYVFCYPMGYSATPTRVTAADYYEYGILMGGGLFVTGGDTFRVPRFYVSRRTGMSSFAKMVEQF